MPKYTRQDIEDVLNFWSISSTAVSGTDNTTRHGRMLWTAKAFADSTDGRFTEDGAYKLLSRTLDGANYDAPAAKETL